MREWLAVQLPVPHSLERPPGIRDLIGRHQQVEVHHHSALDLPWRPTGELESPLEQQRHDSGQVQCLNRFRQGPSETDVADGVQQVLLVKLFGYSRGYLLA